MSRDRNPKTVLRVGLLLTDSVPADYLAISGEYVDMFEALFVDRDVTIVPYRANDRRLPDAVDECDGYLISGSRSSVYDQELWIDELKQFIRDAVARDVPIFGVCFGLQAMAEALGGNVEEFAGGWCGGVVTMTVDTPRSWMAPRQGDVSLIVSHKDQIVTLPAGATRLGSSSRCENFLVEFTPRHVGIQGHPELSPAFAAAVYRSRREKEGTAADDALATLGRPTDVPQVVEWMWNVISGD